MQPNSKYLRLYRATHEAVRSLLSRRNPQMFCFPFQERLFERGDSVSEPLIKNGIKPNIFISETRDGVFYHQHTVDSLAALNGYNKVSEIRLRAALAEGVVAVQDGKLLQHYSIYARPCRRPNFSTKPRLSADDNHITSKFFHPPFCEEDFTLYRILENRLDMYLNNKKESWMKYITTSRVAQVLRSTMGMCSMPSRSEDNAVFRDLGSQSAEVLNDDSKPKEELQETDLLIFYEGKLVVMEQVPVNFRLLTLPPLWINNPRSPYKLKHNTASSIIYTTFVMFGALPFAYRSIKYAIDYPAMVEILLASFFGTLGYSTWYSRYGARVRQQLAVQRAVGSRVIARDDAVFALLVEGAISNVTNRVLGEYAARLSQCERKDLNIEDSNITHGLDIVKELDGDDFDPAGIACEIGLLVKSEREKNIMMPRSVSSVLTILERYKD
ncbi:hypothetical protein HJC23_001455 [Cyclotella cryptica]|uniref:Uncharacterized protein n=1 Tax=Cyclotella cryptica TaxID=29204 RepID=A0ABD3PBH4_9STRA|eukprot:CCRYP_016165-RA/>CCRYP_016165-RA protein AED:0.07 eAED:0.07 QI:0/-1/0/1/-1/1/1/0/440